MSTALNNTEIVPYKGLNGVSGLDNPIPDKRIILSFIDMMIRVYEMERELTIKEASLSMLFIIIAMYHKENRPISQYEIVKQCKKENATIHVYQRCKMMVRKGILERVGQSKFNSPVFVPSYKAMSIIGKYFTLVEVDYIMSELYPLPKVA